MTGQMKSGNGIIKGNYNAEDYSGEGFYEWKDGFKFYIGSVKEDKL